MCGDDDARESGSGSWTWRIGGLGFLRLLSARFPFWPFRCSGDR